MFELYGHFFDFGGPLGPAYDLYITRAPAPVDYNPRNLVRSFSAQVWLAIASCLCLISIMMFLANLTYDSPSLRPWKIAKTEESPFNFVLYPFAKMTEPDPLPWFHKWSTGRLLVFLWSLLSTCVVLFYQSNLRVNLMMIEYEEAPRTLHEVADRGSKIYIYNTALRQRCGEFALINSH